MNVSSITKRRIPDKQGVYFFLGRRKDILYIGKATSLRQRIGSYFDKNIKEIRSPLIEKMVTEATSVEWVETDSVLEAMLLEVNLIRTHTPLYNTRSKDDKSYNHLVITKEDFPRVLVIRGKDLQESSLSSTYSHVYGPFPSGTLFKNALKIIRKLFQFYDTTQSVHKSTSKLEKGKIDFNRQIGLYPEVCSKKEYGRTIRHICLFFEGKKKKIIAELESEMHTLAKAEFFERAHEVKKKIFALQHIQDISLIKNDVRTYKDEKNVRIEAYDIAHLGGKHMVGALAVIDGDETCKDAYRRFIVKNFLKANDPGALQEILTRRLMHTDWKYPDIIVVDGNLIQKNAAQKILKKLNLLIPVVSVVKDDHHNPKKIIGSPRLVAKYKDRVLLANSEAHRFALTFFRKQQKKSFAKGFS